MNVTRRGFLAWDPDAPVTLAAWRDLSFRLWPRRYRGRHRKT